MPDEEAQAGFSVYTLGQLIQALESSERAYEANLRTAQKKEAESPVEAPWYHATAGACKFVPESTSMPGIDRLEALCDEEWGTGLTAESVRKLRGRLCRQLGIGTVQADGFTLQAVADALAPKSGPQKELSPPLPGTATTCPNFSDDDFERALSALDLVLQEHDWEPGENRLDGSSVVDALRAKGITLALARALIGRLIDQEVFTYSARTIAAGSQPAFIIGNTPVNEYRTEPETVENLTTTRETWYAYLVEEREHNAAASEKPAAHSSAAPTKKPANPPVEVFFSYSHKDEALRDELAKHLSMLRNQGLISDWHDRKIGAGTECEGQIDEHLNNAQLVLLLVSADFLASRYCHDLEMNLAMDRHESGEARVIPVILRHCDWQHSRFSKLQAVPKDGKPVTDFRPKDKAYKEITQAIRAALEELVRST